MSELLGFLDEWPLNDGAAGRLLAPSSLIAVQKTGYFLSAARKYPCDSAVTIT